MESDRNENIRTLLDLYFEGETSVEQERELRAYFASAESLPQELCYAKAMFGGMAALAAEECGAGVPMVMPKRNLRRRRIIVGSWAAVVAASVITAAVLILHAPTYCYVNGKPVKDVDQALEYTAQALNALSSLPDPAQVLDPLNKSLDALKTFEATNVN